MKHTLLFLLVYSPIVFAAESLTLGRFLEQVTEKHGQYKSAKMAYEANTLMSDESDLIVATNLFANASHTEDAKPSLLFNYDKITASNYQLGIKKQSSIGLSGKLFYNWDDQYYQGMSFGGAPKANIDGSQGSPTLELSLSLWRNFWGGETKSQMNQLHAKIAAQKFGAAFEMKNILAQAESAYWSLALARESVKVSKDSVQRATELYKWYTYRSNSGLTDKADLLQSEAALQQRKLDFKNAQDAEVMAARAFNAARNVNSSAVAEDLAPMTSASLDQLQIPKRADMRDDTKAALEQSNAAQAADEEARQKYKPQLEIYGTAALNNDNPVLDKDRAFNNSFSSTRPTQVVGLRFSTPLDIGLAMDVRAGHKASAKAAQLTYQRKIFEEEKGWHDLSEKFQQAKGRLTIYDQLEKAQKNKMDYERLRRKNGRTTTQWVIQFESEYEATQLARIQTMSEILQLFAQLKTYAFETATR